MYKKPTYEKLAQRIKELAPGDHLCSLYETEEEHRALFTPFMRQGLERSEKVVYIVDARTEEDVLDYLRDDGIEVEPRLASGQLVLLTVDEAYMSEGVFDPDGMIAFLRDETELALEEGYSGLRVTGEMTWALRGLPGSERLIEYEAKLNEFFPGSKCLAICQYDRRSFEPALLLDVLATHPIAVTGTKVFDNFYYMPPEDFLNPDTAATKLNSWLNSLAERKQAEEALKESEERFRSLFYQAADSVVLIDFETQALVDFNDIAHQNLGFTREEFSDLKIQDLEVVESPEEVKRPAENVKQEVRDTFETRLRAKSGEIHDFLMRRRLVSFGGKNYALGIWHDVTERKHLEAQLQQAQKMGAIGTLAGGIAHDFNNLLMGIQGRTSLMLIDKDFSHPDFEHLRGIEEYLRSAADLTKQLLGFARGGKHDVKLTNLNEIVERTSRMFGRAKKEMKIHVKYQKDIWNVEADQGQIEQVFLNLYLNAWHAMPGGGDLYLETENVTLDESHTKPFAVEHGNYVKISVTDTGVGMDETTRRRIFEPFFTTKEMGRGTGLGLASVYGIIKNHSGIINAYGEKGEGITFDIYLPASGKQAIEEKEPAEKVFKGSETVLLVDDEDMIIDVGEQLLEKLGYKALIARSGKETVEIYEKDKDEIDMVVLDMIMPDMGGSEAYGKLKEINPRVKVLLSSGYSIDGQATEILQQGCDAFIQKPFNLNELSQKIREILDKK